VYNQILFSMSLPRLLRPISLAPIEDALSNSSKSESPVPRHSREKLTLSMFSISPDKNPGVKSAHERFARLGVIASILKNEQKRERCNPPFFSILRRKSRSLSNPPSAATDTSISTPMASRVGEVRDLH
jgi:hypothetical protein